MTDAPANACLLLQLLNSRQQALSQQLNADDLVHLPCASQDTHVLDTADNHDQHNDVRSGAYGSTHTQLQARASSLGLAKRKRELQLSFTPDPAL